jgi:hypothetical protein
MRRYKEIQDKRRFFRVEVFGYATEDIATGTPAGVMFDVSKGGMKLFTKRPFTPNSTFKFRIMKLKDYSKDDLVIHAKCIWLNEIESESLYIAGFSFINESTEQIDVLSQITSL